MTGALRGHQIQDTNLVVIDDDISLSSTNMRVHKYSLTATAPTFIATLAFTDTGQNTKYSYPFKITGTSYMILLPYLTVIHPSLQLKRVDMSLFDLASSFNIDVTGVNVKVVFGNEKTGT